MTAVAPGAAISGAHGATGVSPAAVPRIEGYQILGPLGRGGMGTVWRAMQLSTRREVAVKLLNLSQFGSDRARQRFQREVELAARLRHPNIAAVYDSGLHQGICYYAMELVDGVPLDEYAAKHQSTRAEILRLVRSACEAMAYAHRRGVIHRDLKPSNILVDREGRVRVVDFGLAKAVVANLAEVMGGTSVTYRETNNPVAIAGIGKTFSRIIEKHAATIDAEVVGTPAFMSPEQAAGGLSPLDTRSDVYSLGVILYRLLTNRSPHDLSGSLTDVMRRVASDEPLDPCVANRALDRELRDLLLKALARRPEDRYASADALGRDIDNYTSGEPLTARRPTVSYVLGKRLRRNRVAVMAALGLIIFLCGMAIASYRSIKRARDDAVVARKLAERKGADERIAAREAKTQLIGALISQGDVRAAAGGWLDARGLYEQAKTIQSALGLPCDEINLALAQADLYAPPPLATLGVGPQRFTAASIAMDNRTSATADGTGQVRIWDMLTGRCLRQWNAHAGEVHSLRFGLGNGSRQWLISAGNDKFVKLWDWERGELAHSIPIDDQAGQIAMSGDGEWLASGSMKRLPRLWRLSKRADGIDVISIKIAGWAATPVEAVSFSPDSTRLAYGDWMGNLRVVDMSTLATVDLGTGNQPIRAVAFSPDGKTLTASFAGGSLVAWADGGKGNTLQRFSGLPGAAESIWVSSTGSTLAAFGFDGSVRLLYGSQAEGRAVALAAHTFSGAAPVISPDGRLILGNDADGRLIVHDLSITQQLPLDDLTRMGDSASGWVSAIPRAITCRGHTSAVLSLAISPDEQHLASGGVDHTLRVWDAATGKEQRRIEAPGEVKTLAYSPDGQRLLYGSESGIATVVDAVNAVPVDRSLKVDEPVTSVSFSPDGRTALVGTDHWVRLWDIEQNIVVHSWHPDVTLARGMVFSEDGRTGISSSVHGQAMPADLLNGFPLLWSDTNTSDRRELSSNPASWGDLHRMLAGSGSTVVEWSSDDGKELLRYEGHSASVRAVSVTKDGKWLMSAGDDKTVRLWDRAGGKGREIRVFHLHGMPVVCVAIAADGKMLASADRSGMIRILDLTRPSQLGLKQAHFSRYLAGDI